MPKLSEPIELNEAPRALYPTVYPVEALDDIRRIGRQGSWLESRVALAHAVWEITGFAYSTCIGSPDGQPSSETFSGARQLAAQLLEIRDLVHKGIQTMRATGTPAPLSGDALAERGMLTAARCVEAL